MSHKMQLEADDDDYDVSGSEDDYGEEEKRLLEKVRNKRTVENFDSEDEVYGLHGDESDNDQDASDSMESDIEGQQLDDDLPNEKAWGKKKKAYFSTDYVDQDYATSNQKDLEAAQIEEQEAIAIQKRLTAQLDEGDFGLDLFDVQKTETKAKEESQQIVKTDLSKLSKRQKQELALKESPEFSGLIKDFIDRLTEAKNILKPFMKLLKSGEYPQTNGVNFVTTKYQLILNYCTNILFYLTLKAKRTPVQSHPIVKRLVQYRQLLTQLEDGQGQLLDQVVEILEAANHNQQLYTSENVEFNVNGKRQALSSSNQKLKSMKTDMDISKRETDTRSVDEVEENEEEGAESDEGNVENNELESTNYVDEIEGKRAITYQIAKNKGLTPYRKKELRNPRVKHRNKYRKAKIRRKGAVREVRKELSRYSGEMSGIKASVTKSIKLK